MRLCGRAIAPGVLDQDLFHIQTLQHLMKMTRTWDSTMSMIPKGGDTIWGDLDSAPEDSYTPSRGRRNTTDELSEDGSAEPNRRHYGRIISFGKDIAEADSSEIHRVNFRVRFLIYLMIIAQNIRSFWLVLTFLFINLHF